ncbi:MAG: response regulator transcription factor, partial [Deltaproteobacteria bacterium]|nr:response regulator transcription factor [Deltaproteobacteria bacterium]
MKKVKIMVVDDHGMIAEGVKKTLYKNPKYRIVAKASNGHEAIKLAQKHRPEIVIMDISMPELNGIEATLELRKLFPDIKILIYTMHSDTAYISRVMTAGARGYVLKSDPVDELLIGLDTIHNGGLCFSKIASDQIQREKAGGAIMVESDDELDKLSPRERQVMELLAEGLTPKEISSIMGIAPSTVQSHKFKIFKKLNV